MRGYWVLALLLLPCVHAATLSAQYHIGLTQTSVNYTLSDVQENLSVPVPYDVTTAQINGNQSAVQHSITVTQDTNISYTSSAYTERGNYFVADLARIDAQIQTVTVSLPERARLKRGLNQEDASIHPRPADALSDGRKIMFTWNGEDLEPARAVLVDYETGLPGPGVLLILAGALILAGLVIFVTGRENTNEHEQLTRNLYEEEKRLVEILLAQDDKELWQKELTRKSGLSKVKVSRKLRNLEQKGLIEKIPHGNTNKVRLTRPD